MLYNVIVCVTAIGGGGGIEINRWDMCSVRVSI